MEIATTVGYKGKIIGAELGSPCFHTLGAFRHNVAFSALVIPTDQIDGLSDGEIVNFVKCGIDFAKFFEVYSNAIHIATKIDNMQIEQIDENIEYMIPWRNYDSDKTEIINAVIDSLEKTREEIIQEKQRKEIKREYVKSRRIKFGTNRDRLMIRLIERDGYVCVKCGALKNLSIDHIVPLSAGGGDSLENLQILCKSCNSRKGAK